MRKLIITLVIIVAIAGGAAAYLVLSTPSTSSGIAFPLDAASRAMIAHVPESAEAFALIPAVAALDAKMHANPITRGAAESWSSKQRLPEPWMLGDADLLAWRDGEGRTRYYVRLDPLRALLVRAYVMLNGDIGNTIVINAPAEQAIDPTERDAIVGLADKLPRGDALVVQRRSSRGAFPPIARPAVSSVHVTPAEIDIASRAAADPNAAGAPLNARFPRGAMLTTAFTSAPRVVNDLNRLVGTNVAHLFDSGGAIAIYDIETGKLLPRPVATFIFPDDRARRDAVQKIVAAATPLGVDVHTASRDGQLLLSFDRSLDMYLKDAADAAQWPSARWVARADPGRLVPVLQALGDNVGFRIAAPRLFRSARDVDRWIGALQQAKWIEAADVTDGAAEELKVTIR